jgi:putative membrane protein
MPGSGTDWSAVGEQTATGIWNVLGWVGPTVFGLLLLLALARGYLRRRHYRAVDVFDERDVEAVRQAVVGAERKTVGEILPVIVERSDPHPGASWMAAMAFVLVGSSLLVVWLPWQHPTWVLGTQFLLGLAGFAAARALPDFKRLFVSSSRAEAVCREQAFQEFFGNGLHRTEAATGVLVFVSLLEHRAVVLADEGIDSRVEADFWAEVDRRVLDGIRSGSLRDGLIAGIEQIGDQLADKFPWTEGDRNEVPDRVIVRRE